MVNAMGQAQMYDGAFRVSATARETPAETTAVPLETLEQELWMYIDDAKSTPADPQLLQRIKNAVEAAYLQSLAGTGIAGTLARTEVAYRWQHIEEEYKARMAVTPADMMRVAKTYLVRENSVTGVLHRER
jgi:predicted Zn-dependent peptidase